MIEMITCPQGHTWERPPASEMDGRLRCPTCGLELQTRATLAPPADDSTPETGDGLGPQVSAGATFFETGLRASVNEDAPSRRGRFRILRQHAHGGLGQVSVAQDEDLGREVALKEIRPELAGNPQSRERFVHEARITGQLEHPNIVPVYALGRDEHGRPYYAMRFVKGKTLARAIGDYHAASPSRRGLRDLLTRFVDVCQAMAYAHSRGIIHRDLKPLNVMLGDYGETMILDWGLAKHVGEDPSAEDAATDGAPTSARREAGSHMTREGQLLGTPAYMAPEQARQATEAGPLADVYSLGAILHEILHGHPPTGKASAPATPTTPAGLPAPRPLQSICRKALSPEPPGRYPSVSALGAEVERYLADEPVHAHPDPLPARLARWSRRHKTMAVGLMALVVTGLVALAISNVLVRHQRDQKIAALGEANRQTRLARAALVTAHVRRGWELMDQGNPSLSLLYFTRALQMDADDPQAQADHRVRIATVLASSPQLRADVSAEFRGPMVHGNRWMDWEWDIREVLISELNTGKPIGTPLKHDGPIQIANFSPDGTRVLTTSSDGTARIWDAATGAPVTPPLAHEPGKNLPDGNFSPDGSRVATATYDDVRVWDVASGRMLFDPIEFPAGSMSAWFSPDGTKLLVVGEDGSRIYDAATGRPLTELMETKTDFQSSTAAIGLFSGDGLRVATYNAAATVRVWEVATGKPLSPELQCEDFARIAFRGDGKRLIVGDAKSLRVWDEAKPEAWYTPLAHGDEVTGIGYSLDGRRFYTTWGDHTARVWDAETLKPVTPPLLHPAGIAEATFTPDGRHLVTVDDERTVRAWEAAGTWPSGVLRRAGLGRYGLASVRGLVFDGPKKRLVAVSNRDKATRVWDAGTLEPLTPDMEHSGAVYEANFSPDGRRLVTGTDDGMVRVWDAATGTPLLGPISVGSAVSTVAFSRDGRWLATATEGGSVRIWDAQDGSPRTPAIVCNGEAAAQFSADDRQVLTYDDTAARLWDATTGAAVTPPMEHGHYLRWAALESDGHRVFTFGEDAARLWEAGTGRPIGKPMSHGSEMNDADVSPDGRVVATAGRDRTGRLWDAETGEPLTSPLPHPESVERVRFSADGRRLLTHCRERGARLWEVRTGDALTPTMVFNDIDDFELSPDGRAVVADGHATSEIRAWDITPDPRPADDLARLAELLSGRRLDGQGGAVPLTPDEWAQRWQDLTRRYPTQFTPHSPNATQPTRNGTDK